LLCAAAPPSGITPARWSWYSFCFADSPKSTTDRAGAGSTSTAALSLDGFPNPLDEADSDLEEALWESQELVDLIGRAPMMSDQKYIVTILELLIRGYAELIIDGQVKMLTSTLAADERLSMGLQQRPIWTSLEEPFCWRPLSNRLGLHAFALDLFLWRTKMTAIGDNPSKKGRLRPAKRGFSERGSGYENSAANLEGFSTEDASLHCGFVEYVVAEFEKICGSGSDFCSPRVLLPSNLLVPFQGYLEAKDACPAWDVVEYSGDSPRTELLVTVQHSVVIVVREAAWSSPERAWQLHADALGDEEVFHDLHLVLLGYHHWRLPFQVHGVNWDLV
jgi:hypothetical protein